MSTQPARGDFLNLGTIEDMNRLFSYPLKHDELFELTQEGRGLKTSLSETIAWYVNSSLRRDGYNEAEAVVKAEDGHVALTITGHGMAAEAPQMYVQALARFLEIGKTGWECSKMNAVEQNWHYNWRFFLPLGLAMVNHKSVQLLHFPPDSVLERDQDYLKASTTRRWAKLLIANGVPAAETDVYQNIVDIAPVSAPAADGVNLNVKFCATYTPYITMLLEAWVPMGNCARPMVGFGLPVRQWLQERLGIPESLGVLKLVTFGLQSGLSVPVLTANHPSMIFNLDDKLKDLIETPEDDRICPLIPTMQEDLIAAAWQVRMSADPLSSPEAILQECMATWRDEVRTPDICRLIYEQVFNLSKEDALRMIEERPISPVAMEVVRNPSGEIALKFREIVRNF